MCYLHFSWLFFWYRVNYLNLFFQRNSLVFVCFFFLFCKFYSLFFPLELFCFSRPISWIEYLKKKKMLSFQGSNIPFRYLLLGAQVLKYCTFNCHSVSNIFSSHYGSKLNWLEVEESYFNDCINLQIVFSANNWLVNIPS